MSFFTPYSQLARWDKPIGYMLLFWPCAWGLLLHPNFTTTHTYYLVLFFVGAIAMRGAGCTFNDWCDRGLDAQVERTKHRPLASGAVSSKQAFVFIGLQLLVGLGVWLMLPPLAKLISLGAGVPLAIIYPLLKRYTWWPQLGLGLAFNIGALVGWACLGPLSHAPVALYLAGVVWTLCYDTVYAFQDYDDDVAANIKSTARRFGHNYAKIWLRGFWLLMLALLMLAGVHMQASPWFYFVAASACLRGFNRLKLWDSYDRADCLQLFKAHNWDGLTIALACMLA